MAVSFSDLMRFFQQNPQNAPMAPQDGIEGITVTAPKAAPQAPPRVPLAPIPQTAPKLDPRSLKQAQMGTDLGSYPQADPGSYPELNTKLGPDEEPLFQAWKKLYAPQDSGQDYDLRGAFKSGFKPDPQTGHWGDTYKKPNHPTFSNQSKWAGDYPDKAGTWNGETYVPPTPDTSYDPRADEFGGEKYTPLKKLWEDMTKTGLVGQYGKTPWDRMAAAQGKPLTDPERLSAATEFVGFGGTIGKVGKLARGGNTSPQRLVGADNPYLISTARPTAAGYEKFGNPETDLLLQNTDRMRLSPKAFEKNASQLLEEPFMARMKGATDPEEIVQYALDSGSKNLSTIMDRAIAPKEMDEVKRWYETANRISKQKATSTGIPEVGSHGVMAVTSAQTPWPINVARHDRLLEMARDGFDLSKRDIPKAISWAKSEAERSPKGAWAKLPQSEVEFIARTPMDDLKTDTQKYFKVTMLDAIRNDPMVRDLRASGEYGDPFGKITWGSGNMIGKALRILKDPTVERVSSEMGGGGKVPSFYNNIAAPESNAPISTIDTHSAGAATLYPGGGDDTVVYRAMGLSPKKGMPQGAADHASAGSRGHYGLYNDMHTMAGKDAAMKGREVQSATWEGVRRLWGTTSKTKDLKAKVADLWRNSSSDNEARDRIMTMLTNMSKAN